MHPKAAIQKIPRSFLPADYIVTDWISLEPYFKELTERPLNSKADLSQWLQDLSELEAVVSEDACWRQIKMTCETTDIVTGKQIGRASCRERVFRAV